MIRRPHVLKGTKNTELPHNAIWVDTETRERKHRGKVTTHHLWFGWAAAQRIRSHEEWTEPEWCRFTKPLSFWQWVEGRTRPKTRTYLFAHNWAFDAAVLDTFTQLPKLGWRLTSCVIECPPVILVWRKGDRTLEMLDTLNWWRMPLAKLGESVGAPKQAFPSAKASRATWDAYCRNDVEVTRAALHRWWAFLRAYDLGGFARTLAGQAMRAYRHKFMPHPILIDADERATALARASYYGGRTEAFRLGRIQGPVEVYDVNSMYPAVMRTEHYPSVLILHTRKGSVDEVARWIKTRCVVASCIVETDEPAYAVSNGAKLIFPVGRFPATLTTPDLAYAIKHGHLREVSDVAVYERHRLFESFVETLYALRQRATAEGNQVDRFMLKILMNSLYGKFGQSGRVWETVGEAETLDVRTWVEVDADTGDQYNYRQLAGVLQELRREPESYSSHPAIAAHVTAYARRLLWKLVTLAGREHVFYVDTDSLYVDREGSKRLAAHVDNDRLGALKHEATHEWIHIHGCKDYVTPTGRKTKGVKSSAEWLAENTVEQLQWSSLVGLIARGQANAPVTRTVRKTLRRIYTKGTVTAHGRVLPLRLGDGTD